MYIDKQKAYRAAAEDELEDVHLDHLLYLSDGNQAYPASMADHSVMAAVMTSDGDISGYDRATDSLEALRDLLDSLLLTSTGVGRYNYAATTHNLAAGAATTTLLTGTGQAVILESITVRLPDVNMSDDAGAYTGFSIQLTGTNNTTLITTAQGAKANCTAEAQMAWTGSVYVPVGELIQIVVTGGAGDATTTANIVAGYRSVVAGGTLA